MATNAIENCVPIKVENSNEATSKIPDSLLANISAEALLDLPEWFLQNCVKTSEELNRHNSRLIVRDFDHSALDKERNFLHVESDPEKYEIESVMYEKMQDFISSITSGTQGWKTPDTDARLGFTNDAALLRFPDDHKGLSFLNAVVEHFAKDVGADLITLIFEDFEDLSEHFAIKQGTNRCGDVDCYIRKYFDSEHVCKDVSEENHALDRVNLGELGMTLSTKKSKKDKKRRSQDCVNEVKVDDEKVDANKMDEVKEEKWFTINEAAQFPFPLVLGSPATKRNSGTSLDANQKQVRPLIILIPEVYNFAKNRIRCNILRELQKAGKKCAGDDRVFLITTDCNCRNDPYEYNDGANIKDSTILFTIGQNPAKRVTRIVPVKSHAQRVLLDKDQERGIERRNIRKLQKQIRQHPSVDKSSFLLSPYAKWGLDEGSPASARLRKKSLDGDDFDQAVHSIVKNVEAGHIKKVFKRINCNIEALDKWNQSSDSRKWSSLPVKAQEVIEEIESHEDKYLYEKGLLDLLVNPDNVEETWADIELESDVRNAITQMVGLVMSDRQGPGAYGILKTGRIGGALLYGPPGTGKTQLARVLARESRAVMIHASMAEIETKWVGETEKIIKAMFHLGRMLTPAIIFIDEADALFRERGIHDRGHERSRMSQLLNETDGLTGAANSSHPFLILATNFPRHLDNAVLRRVPGRLFIGMPSLDSRERIFSICLRDECQAPDLNLRVLAQQTRWYTGSDIRTLCIQAALICENELKSCKSDGKRVLRKAHFREAQRRTGPTVSRKALADIREFAMEFDPAAVEKMDSVEALTEIIADDKEVEIESKENINTPGGEDTPTNWETNNANHVHQDLYSYQPLVDSSMNQSVLDAYRPIPRIRLLHLFPGRNMEPLECSLEISSPFPGMDRGRETKNPLTSYEAISYAWGNGIRKEDVLCDGKTLEITFSLASTLRRLRLSDRKRVIWVDGICINQKDFEERAQQVIFMAAIYSQAQRVLCWLGEDEGDHAKRTFEMATRLCANSEPPPDNGEYTEMKDRHGNTFRAERYLTSALHFSHEELERQLEDRCNVDHVKELFKKPWFRRMWIRQEIGYASTALVLCGESEINWSSLEWFRSWTGFKCRISTGGTRMRLGNFRDARVFSKNSTESFFDLLLESGRFECSDPRDRIFALLSHPSAYQELTGVTRDYRADIVKTISQGDDNNTMDAKIASARADLYAKIGEFTTSLVDELEDGDPWKDLYMNLAKVLDAASSVFSVSSAREVGKNSVDASLDDNSLETMISKLGELKQFEKTAQVVWYNLIHQRDNARKNMLLEERPDSHDNSSSKYSGDDIDTIETDSTAAIDPAEHQRMFKLLTFQSEARKLDELENPEKHPLYRLQPMSGECVLSVLIIKADYRRPIEDIYLEIAKTIVKGSQNLRILSAVRHDANNTKLGATLPSWVPRWDCHVNIFTPGLKKSSEFESWTGEIPFEEAMKIDGDFLECSGIAIDTIASRTDPIAKESFLDSEGLIKFWKTLLDWETPQFSTELERFKAYQRLLTAVDIGGFFMSVLGLGTDDEQMLHDFADYWVPFYEATQTVLPKIGDQELVPKFFPIPEMEKMAMCGNSGDFVKHALSISRGLRAFQTREGLIGTGPGILEEGDVVCILPSSVPYVLRRRDDYYLLVGACYVDGAMKGEKFDASKVETLSIH